MKQLRPFSTTALTDSLTISADFFQVSAGHLLLEFEITGNLDKVVWPASLAQETREDGLWQHTCLEAFYSSGSDAASPYTEINCSPNGNWNAYNFSSYREGMTPASDITVRLKERESQGDHSRFQIELHSSRPLSIESLGLSAVIEFSTGEKSYWALSHPGSQADFHNKGGWFRATH